MLRVRSVVNSLCVWGARLTILMLSTGSWALEPDQFQQQSAYDGMEIEDLMGLSISSLSKHQEPVSRAAAAVYVLTSEDIRRSPVTTLIEALRLIPGLNVQRINNTQFNVSIRGLNGSFPKHLLVMVDGRSIYNPLYAGVYWEQRDLPLSIIDRIEVVRGPGGAVWGSNALNGVINIITKPSNLQRGGELITQGSSLERQATAVLGGGIGNSQKSSSWRFFVDEHHYQQSDKVIDDSGHTRRIGGRIDTVFNDHLQWWVDGQYYHTATHHLENIFHEKSPVNISAGVPLAQNIAVDIDGYSVNTQLSQNLSNDQQWSVQFFAEYYDRDIEHLLREQQGQFDASGQYRFLTEGHDVTLGVSYRGYTDKYTGYETAYLQPESEYNFLVSGFVQDQLAFAEHWILTLGVKYERHRVQSGFFQPTVRLSWSDADDLTVWLAYSEAMQAQTRDYRGIYWRLGCACNTPIGQLLDSLRPDQRNALPDIVATFAQSNPDAVIPVITALEGEQGNEFETRLTAWEWGVRAVPAEGWVVDLSVYRQEYSDIVTAVTSEYRLHGDVGIDYVERILHYTEGANAQTEGADIVLTWHPGKTMSWRAAYSYFNVDVKAKDSGSAYFEYQEYVDPMHQASLQHDWQLNGRWHINTFVRYVSVAPYFLVWEAVDAYTTVDMKVSYKILPELDLYAVGKNLLDGDHVEGRVVSDQPNAETALERTFALGLRMEF